MKTQNHWTVDEIPELAGKVPINTGANSGIGFEASRFLVNLLFAYELQRRLHAAGSSTISLAAVNLADTRAVGTPVRG